MDIVGIILIIGKAHLYTAGIIGASYIMEKITGLNLLIDHYTWEKSPYNADVLSSRDSGYYFILNLIVFGYDIYKGVIAVNVFNIALWLVVMYFFVKVFYHIHRKHQAIDSSKADDDYS